MAIGRKITPRLQGAANDPTKTLEALRERLRSAGLLTVPLNVRAVAEFLGVEVVEEAMDDDLSGYLEMRNGHWVAGINAFHHNNRKRFTVAHEIAHLLLHSSDETSFHDRTFARREAEGKPMEREADAFAAALLMPANDVRQAIAAGETSLSTLAERFKVSALAMKFRVMKLGYRVNQ
jgi:Zn-dependent peptidase ImmA (M78 family)